jgi:hypothetical protein
MGDPREKQVLHFVQDDKVTLLFGMTIYPESALAPDPRHQLLDLRLLLTRKRQER